MLLLESVKYVTMIDWTNAEEFKDLPLLPEDFTWPELAQVIGKGKQIGPLFHYSGFLPYTMQTVQKLTATATCSHYRLFDKILNNLLFVD